MKSNFLSRVGTKIYYAIADGLTPRFSPEAHNNKKWEIKNSWLRRSGIAIDSNVTIDEKFFILKGFESNLSIGDYTAIGIGCQIWPFSEIKIGKYNMFAANVELTNGGHDVDTFEPYSKPLIIGNGCWIGHGVKILKGVTIGDNVVIGGGSVVVDDIPDNAVAVGVPAKVIKYRDLPEKVWHLGNEYFCPKTFTLIENNNE